MVSIKKNIELITEDEFEKILKNKKNNIEYITEELGKYQKKMQEEKGSWKKLIFNWSNSNEEYVETIEETRIHEWLQGIKFKKISALILEEFNWNIDYILRNREEMLKEIQTKMEITKENFFEELEGIKKTLIVKNRVKICQDGRIIIMNEYESICINRRKKYGAILYHTGKNKREI